jgi:hypothetical protein
MKKCMVYLAVSLFLPTCCADLAAQAAVVSGSNPTASLSASLDHNLLVADSAVSNPSLVSQSLDGVFAISGFQPSIADSLSITSQIAASQSLYLSGQYPALSEGNVVTALNNLVTAWGLPSYALTSAAEVRQLHISLMLGYPQYILGGANGQPGTTLLVRTALSPMETTFLFSMLVRQKLSNPVYQMTAAQFAAYNSAIAAGQTPPALQDQSAALNAAIQSAMANVGALGVMQQLNQTMTDLGVIGGAQ